jgi:hypothetical protein
LEPERVCEASEHFFGAVIFGAVIGLDVARDLVCEAPHAPEQPCRRPAGMKWEVRETCAA